MEEKNKILTVVIPAYNVEKYLRQTLESFVSKDIMENLEVLIVNDGSKDGTADIAAEYEKKYPQTFHLINKENGGHGSTINRGIELATGKYFKVVDGDDWVNTEDFVKLIYELERCKSEFVVTKYYEVNDVTGEKTLVDYPELQEKREWDFEEIADKSVVTMHALVIRTDILQENNIRLTEHCFYVDNEYTTFPVPYVKTVEYLHIAVYMYRLAVATQSVSMQGFRNHIENHLTVIRSLLDFLDECDKKNVEQFKIDYIVERTAITVATQAGIYVSFPLKDEKRKQEFMLFDREVKSRNSAVYKKAGEKSKVLRGLRKSGFRHYAFWVTIGKIRARIRG